MNNKNFRKTPITLLQGFLAAAALMTASMGPVLAAPKVEILGAKYGGSGCPQGSASVTVSPDAQEVSILFDKYIAKANSGESYRKCDLSIPIKVPPGYQVSIFKADFRGYVAEKTTGTLRAEYFFAGTTGPKYSNTIVGEKTYTIRHPLLVESWSPCGDSFNMRANTSMVAKAKKEVQGVATVDSVDLTNAGLIYYLKYRGCPSR